MKHFFLLLALLLASFVGRAQAVATLTPAQPAALTDSMTVTFDATRGDGGLAAWAGDVYVHTGVITPASTSLTDWQHVQGVWGQLIPRLKMRALGNRRYAFRMKPSAFYGLAVGERVLQFAFVFRNADGSASGRNADGSDVLLPLYAATSRSYVSHQWAGGLLTVTASDGARLTAQPYAAAVLRMGFYPSGTPAVPGSTTANSVSSSPIFTALRLGWSGNS